MQLGETLGAHSRDSILRGVLDGIDHVQLAAPPGCEAEARRFFGELLGLEELEKPESLRARGGVWFRVGAQQLHIGVEPEFAPARKAHPAFAVSRYDELLDRLRPRALRWPTTPRSPAFAGAIHTIRGGTGSSSSRLRTAR